MLERQPAWAESAGISLYIYGSYSTMHDQSSEPETLSPAVPLNSVLSDLRLRGVHYCRTEVSQPWGLTLPYQDGVRFHFIVEGEAWLIIDDHAPVLMETGDIVLLPRGSGHVIADQPGRRPTAVLDLAAQPIGDRVYRLRAGGPGEKALIICSTLLFEQPALHPLIAMMPKTLHVRRTAVHDPALPVLIDLMTSEAQEEKIGWATVMTRIADVVVARLIRGWVDREGTVVTGWLAAMQDPHIGRALVAIHEHPETLWSIDALATQAGLSRSVFHRRFATLLDASPAKYATGWRMRVAGGWLSNGSMSVGQAAAKLGYESQAAFSRAFKRALGVSPGAFRRTKKQALGSARREPTEN